jgi:hypothetical protein
LVGLLHGGFNFGISSGPANRYVIATFATEGRFRDCRFHEVPVEARPKPPNIGNVFGCGILMDPDNKLTTFFTLNSILLGEFFLLKVSSKFQQKYQPNINRLVRNIIL